jgi:hypothetical protein
MKQIMKIPSISPFTPLTNPVTCLIFINCIIHYARQVRCFNGALCEDLPMVCFAMFVYFSICTRPLSTCLGQTCVCG